MASSGGAAGSGSGGWPKILLAKPNVSRPDSAPVGSSASTGVVKLMREREENATLHSRLPQGSLNLISESWEFTPDRLHFLLSENTDFTVIGVLGPPGAGKSTVLNEIYGFDGDTPGVLPPFQVQNEETKVIARHCTTGIEVRVTAERIILLDTQPVCSASVLADVMRPDGSSILSVFGGDNMSAELAHELMDLQLGVFLSSVCHVLLVVTEGLHDLSVWRLMQTVEMLKQGIPDPSMLGPIAGSNQHVQMATMSSGLSDKEVLEMAQGDAEFFSDTVFVHTKLNENEFSFNNIINLELALSTYFTSSAFKNRTFRYLPPQFPAHQSTLSQTQAPTNEGGETGAASHDVSVIIKKLKTAECMSNYSSHRIEDCNGQNGFQHGANLYVLPFKGPDEVVKRQHESYMSLLKRLRDQILSVSRKPFSRPLTERDWLRNAARIWDLLKKSPALTDYSRMLQESGHFKR